jgi:hypothetical protein
MSLAMWFNWPETAVAQYKIACALWLRRAKS